MKVLLIGNFGSGNIGDELILASSLRDYPNAVVMTADPEFSRHFCGRTLETVPFPPTGVRSAWKYLFSSRYRKAFALQGIQQVVFPGGGLFAIKPKACWIWFQIFRWVKRVYTGSIHLLHQGVDEHLGWWSRLITKFVLSRASTVTVRDESSRRAVQALCGKNVENDHDKLQTIKLQTTNKKEKMVLINARAKFDAKMLKRFEGQEMIFVAFDRSDLKYVPQDFEGEVVYPKTEKEVFDLFTKAQYVVGERFHVLLLGSHFCGTDKTFVLREPYAEKVKSFCEKEKIQSLSC